MIHWFFSEILSKRDQVMEGTLSGISITTCFLCIGYEGIPKLPRVLRGMYEVYTISREI